MRLLMISVLGVCFTAGHLVGQSEIGREVAIPRHLQDGEEFAISPGALISYGKRLFEARFTSQEGAGRPLTKGTGAPLSQQPLYVPAITLAIMEGDWSYVSSF